MRALAFGLGLALAWTPTSAQEPPHPIAVVTSAAPADASFSRWTLRLSMTVPPGLHVYAKDGPGFEAVSLRMRAVTGVKAGPPAWPEPTDLLFGLSQLVKVHEGAVTASIDLSLTPARARDMRAGAGLTLPATLRYQACTDEACYKAREMPIEWTLRGRR